MSVTASTAVALANGREFLAIPGPSVIPDRVLRAMNRPAIGIYDGEIVEITNGILRDLRPIAGTTAARPFIYIANGHGAWEASIANTMSRGDRVLVLESGRFAPGWGEIARAMGVQPEILNAAPGRAVDPDAVEDRLRADAGHAIKAVLVVQVDTASSVHNDIPAIRKAIDAAGHPALFMVDVIASQGCAPYHMDDWGVDVTVGGAQKGLMTPPGLGFCWANDRARAMEKTADLRTDYWSWTARSGGEQYQNFAGTAPIHHLFALRESLDMLAEEGLPNVWARHAALARAVRAAVAAWAAEGPLAFHVAEPSERADSVTTIRAEGADPEGLRAFCQREMGLVLGTALGDLSGRAFRIGHMGWLNAPMVMGALGVVQAALQARGVRVGAGGLEAAAATLAAHFTGEARIAAQ